MEKENLGNRMIIIGLTLYFGAIILLGLIEIYWNINYYKIIYEILFWAKELIILGSIIVGIINIIAIIIIIIGTLRKKISFDFWFVIIGTILIMSSLSSGWLSILNELLGVFPIISSEIFYLIMIIVIIFGILFVIIGGLLKPRK